MMLTFKIQMGTTPSMDFSKGTAFLRDNITALYTRSYENYYLNIDFSGNKCKMIGFGIAGMTRQI